MLETTLSTTFVPGTNLKGQVAGANWLFLLPNLDLGQVLCLGRPAKSTLITLARSGQSVVVAFDSPQPQTLDNGRSAGEWPNLRTIITNGREVMPFPDRSLDLVLITGRRSFQQLSDNQARRVELQRLLKPEGFIYLDLNGLVERWLGQKVMQSLQKEFTASRVFWLTPLAGEMHTAVPADDHQTIAYFLRHHLYSPAVKLRGFAHAERLLNKRLFTSELAFRRSVLVTASSQVALDRPPQYLCELAHQAGLDLNSYRWGLSARGEYSSRKLLFFLFKAAHNTPEYVVKMVRDPKFNARLENEAQALRRLREIGLGTDETLPRVVFCGHHHKLAIVGENAIQGAPLRQQTSGNANCAYAHSAVKWLIELGVTTANCSTAAPTQVANKLMKLFNQFTAIYQVDRELHAFLQNQIETLSRSTEPFPLVFQHGDPGTWNVLVTPSGQAVFLDWEAAEPQGMPLWDLFYFMRSYGVWGARLAGTRNSLKAFNQQFLAETELSNFFLDAIHRFCWQSRLDHSLIEPLFYTCWMHRALKEATRLKPSRIDNGHYVSLLRLCIKQRNHSPTLNRLFS